MHTITTGSSKPYRYYGAITNKNSPHDFKLYLLTLLSLNAVDEQFFVSLLSNSIEMYNTALQGVFATSVKVYRIPELARILCCLNN